VRLTHRPYRYGFVLLKLQYSALGCQHYPVAKLVKALHQCIVQSTHLPHLIAQNERVIAWQISTQVSDAIALCSLYKI
jgi:hypothetical protein